jgi:hypothetical protein
MGEWFKYLRGHYWPYVFGAVTLLIWVWGAATSAFDAARVLMSPAEWQLVGGLGFIIVTLFIVARADYRSWQAEQKVGAGVDPAPPPAPPKTEAEVQRERERDLGYSTLELGRMLSRLAGARSSHSFRLDPDETGKVASALLTLKKAGFDLGVDWRSIEESRQGASDLSALLMFVGRHIYDGHVEQAKACLADRGK